ncbi:MAG: endonuclease NucS, partial [Propionicimonas sp.]|nr:endonuclease NucS [Propionicimonas sp.]
MRLLIARCQVDYAGRLTAHLPMATRLIMVKADGSVSIHADDRAYKPLNWMSAPCTIAVREPEADVEAVPAGDEAGLLYHADAA